jgi:hypothetical protein
VAFDPPINDASDMGAFVDVLLDEIACLCECRAAGGFPEEDVVAFPADKLFDGETGVDDDPCNLPIESSTS